MTNIRLVALLVVASAAPMLSQSASVDSRSGNRGARRLLDAAIEASGGLAKLQAITTVVLHEVGTHQWVQQSARATPPWRKGDREELTVLDRGEERLLIKTTVSHPRYYFGWSGTIVTGATGYTLDHYSRMVVPVARTSLDAHRAHLYQRLPHEILLDAKARALSLRHLGRGLAAGRSQDVVSYVSFDGRQTALYLDAATRLLTQYEVIFTDPVMGDNVTGVRFNGYHPIEGVQVPARREQFRGVDWVIRAEYRNIAFNSAIDVDNFRVPPGYEEVSPAPTPTPEITEVAPGVMFLSGLGGGGRYNVMFATFADHVVVINAPAPVSVTEDAIGRIAAKVPDKPIRTVVLTHPAYDHIAGVRAFVARGATVIAAPQARALAEQIVKAPFTIEPDALARVPRALRFEDLGGRRWVLADANQRIELIDIGPDETGEDILVAYFPSARLLFQADIVNPNYTGAMGKAQPAAVMLERRLIELGLAVDRIAGGHGGIIDREALRRSVSLVARTYERQP